MAELLSDLLSAAAARAPESPAVSYRDETVSYAGLARRVERAARGLIGLGLGRGERVAVYLEKRIETVTAMFGAARAGGAFVPVNPLLKPAQVRHILRDCNVRVLVTSSARLDALAGALADCHDLNTVITVDGAPAGLPDHIAGLGWNVLADGAADGGAGPHRVIDTDMARGAKDKYDKLIYEQDLLPIKRWGKTEDVAKAVLAIVDGYFPYSTGCVIDVDGGYHIRRL